MKKQIALALGFSAIILIFLLTMESVEATGKYEGLEDIVNIAQLEGNNGWPEPEIICELPSAAGFAATSDSSGNLHLIWHEMVWLTDHWGVRIYYTKRSSNGWSAPKPLFTLDGSLIVVFPPDIVSDGLDHLHAVFIANLSNSPGVYYTKWDGENWSYPLNVTNSSLNMYFGLEIACDNNDKLHLVWTEGTRLEVFYTYWNGQEWSSPVQISPSWTSNGCVLPVISIDNNNYPYVAMLPVGPGNLLYTKWNGVEWSEAEDLNVPGGGDSGGAEHGIAIDNLNQPHILTPGGPPWSLPYGTWHRYWNGSNWTYPIMISNSVGWTSDIRVKSDESGNIHAIWLEPLPSPETANKIVYSYYNGQTWSSPETVITGQCNPLDLEIDSNDCVHVIASYHDEQENKDYLVDVIPPALITGLSPASGPVGTKVKISGFNFGSAQGMATFNGVSAPISSWTDTQIVTVVPSGATTGPVVVHTSAGKDSNGVTFTVTVPIPPPSISGLQPDHGPVGKPVTIIGSNFGSAQGTVTFNGTIAIITSWSDAEIKITVPTGASSGPVVAHTPDGRDSNGYDFIITEGFVMPVHGIRHSACPSTGEHQSMVWTARYGGNDNDRCEGTGGHPGVDITPSTQDEEIHCIGSGVVEIKHDKVTDAYGKYVIVRHENVEFDVYTGTVYSIYCHLKSINHQVIEGQSIGRGQLIGIMGNTSTVKGMDVHLHFQVDKNRATIPFWPKYTSSNSKKPQSYPSTQVCKNPLTGKKDEWCDIVILNEAQRQEAAQNVRLNTLSPLSMIENGSYR